jgi:uncharacterized protein YeaO (DUF488 family)
MVLVKRIYDQASPSDGFRILIDRLWPRGINKENARIDEWMKEIAPSTELRKWFNHEPAGWEEFQRRYVKELEGKSALLEEIRARVAAEGTVTLLYATRETEKNHAVLLKRILAESQSSAR